MMNRIQGSAVRDIRFLLCKSAQIIQLILKVLLKT